tara:strand:- start:1436 stop:2353 length:918 start_codon:yes stop_codon:yes gene_type:complete
MAITTTTASYKIDLSNGLGFSLYTTADEIKTWTLDGLLLDKYPTAVTLVGTIFTQTLADSSTLTVDLNSLTSTSKVPTGLSYSDGTDLLTLTLSDSSSFVTSIPNSNTDISSFVWTDASNTLTITENDGTVFSTDLSNLDKAVVSGTHVTATETLTLTNADATTVDIDLTILSNTQYSIGSSLDTIGTFDAKYTTADFIIPSTVGDIMMLGDLSTATVPITLSLPAVAEVPMGWECTIFTYDSAGTGLTSLLTVDGGLTSIYNDILDPFNGLSPYSNLISTLGIEPGHLYRIKKVSSQFYVIHYR